VLFFFLALLAPFASAQKNARGQPEVTSMLSAGVVKLGASVRWMVRVEGTTEAKIVAVPKVQGLQIDPPGSPRVDQSATYISGRTTVSITLTWVLLVQPMDEGDYTIPPLELEVDGKKVLTEELSLRALRDMKGEDLGYFEIDSPPTRVYEGQPFDLDMRCGWEADLDVGSARLILPWWGQLRGVLEIADDDRDLSAKILNFGLNSRSQVHVEEMSAQSRNGQPFRAFRLHRRYIASRSGTLEIPESYLEFGTLVAGSQRGIFGSQELEEHYVHLPAFSIEVRAIPEEGRPFEWTGAVGEFTVARQVNRRDLAAGESLELTVTWSGEGNLEFFDPPDVTRLDSFAGFRCFGTKSEFLGDARRVTYDLVPTSPEITEVPPVPLSYFDTKSESYKKIETEAVPIRVRAPASTSTLAAEGTHGPVSDIRDIETRPAEGSDLPRPGAATLGATFVGLPVGWLLLRVIARRRGDPDAPGQRSRRRARRELGRALARATTPAEQALALARFLAARTGEAEQAWLGRDPLEWARERAARSLALDETDAKAPGQEAMRELHALFEELDEHTWGARASSGTPLPREKILAVADKLVQGGM
jgi:hypothetical protein